jgi:RalA-binding protein 1
MIPILNAEIGRQHKDSSSGPQDDKAYRHALLIIEAKKANGTAGLKHVLCAESDQERDAWVAELLIASNKSTNAQTASGSSAGPVNSSTSPLPRQSTSSSLVSDIKASEQDQGTVGPPVTSRSIPPRPQAQSAGNSISSSPSNNELSRSLPTDMADSNDATITDRVRQSGFPSKGPASSSIATNSPGRMKRQSATRHYRKTRILRKHH